MSQKPKIYQSILKDYGNNGGGIGIGFDTQKQKNDTISNALVIPSINIEIHELQKLLDTKQHVLVSTTNIKSINGKSILGKGDLPVSVDLSNFLNKQQVNSLIIDVEGHVTDVQMALKKKQDILISTKNIKTINGVSLLGNGDLPISGDLSNYYTKTEINKLIADFEHALTNFMSDMGKFHDKLIAIDINIEKGFYWKPMNLKSGAGTNTIIVDFPFIRPQNTYLIGFNWINSKITLSLTFKEYNYNTVGNGNMIVEQFLSVANRQKGDVIKILDVQTLNVAPSVNKVFIDSLSGVTNGTISEIYVKTPLDK